MIEAAWYGLIAALSFVGFVSLIYLLLLFVYRPKGCGRYIVTIDGDMNTKEIENAFYCAYVRNQLFADLFSDRVVVQYASLNEEQLKLLILLADEYPAIEICNLNKTMEYTVGKETDGDGAC